MASRRASMALWVATALVVGTAARARAQAAWTEAVTVPHAAFAEPGVPSALVHAPEGFDAHEPLHLVVFLHGYTACAAMIMHDGAVSCRPGEPPREGRRLARAHDASGVGSLFIVAQLALLKPSGKAGCFAQAGCFRAFLQELLAALPLARVSPRKTLADVAEITLVAHSAGYESALAVLQHGGVDALLRDIVLFDALYGNEDDFLRWIAEHPRARLTSLHMRGGRPSKHSAALLRAARGKLGAGAVAHIHAAPDSPGFATALAGARVATAHLEGGHRELPTLHLTAVLRALASAERR